MFTSKKEFKNDFSQESTPMSSINISCHQSSNNANVLAFDKSVNSITSECELLKPALKAENLSFYYRKTQRLFDINLDIPNNGITCLIGASGSGKSTLLRVFNQIYRLYPEQRADGKVIFEGCNILDGKADLYELRKKIGMVFQRPSPFPMSIYDNVAYGIKLHERLSRRELSERVEEALRQAALFDEVKDNLKGDARGLSGGQQQRLCIARAISTKPKILLLDEPTSALDPHSTQQIEDLIQTFKQNTSIIWVTHQLAQAKRISDRVVFMQSGKIIEEGDTLSLFNSPKHEATLHYVSNH